jgi:ATP-dependent Lon protease
VPLKPQDKQSLLEELDTEKRIRRLIELVDAEAEVVRMQRKVRGRFKKPSEVRQQKSQQEQASEAQEELQDEFKNELNELERKFKEKPLTPEARERVSRELKKLRMMSMMSAEATVVRSYLDWVLALPWQHYSEDRIDISRAEEILDEDHYGLEKVKERILEHLAVQKLVDRSKGPILCLVGPPGVGKTSLAKSIARSTGREFVRLSLGGVRDEAEIRGHRRTYIGALPGKIIASFKRAGTSNPVVLLDEIDKMSQDFRGDPAAALLEVLDPEQNHSFVDHYLDLDYDLSKVLFVCTANNMAGISGPLQDRLETIRLAGYTDLEKLAIAKSYLVPKQLQANGLASFAPVHERNEDGSRIQLGGANVTFDDNGLKKILNSYTREAGVRNLEREIGTCSRKAAIELLKRVGDDEDAQEVEAKHVEAEQVEAEAATGSSEETDEFPTAPRGEGDAPPPLPGKVEGVIAEDEDPDAPDPRKEARRRRLDGQSLKVTAKKVRTYLGIEKYRRRDTDGQDQVGVTNGLAWTSVGGEILLTEVALTPGKGKLQVTGKLGDVMTESAKAAMTYVRSRATSLGLARDFYDRIDVHIHVPEGATPKDGPSAGITIATSLVSALTRIPVRHDIAMTGEITLRGRVMPIGGLKEKALAAYRAGCKTIIIPADNEKDLPDIPSMVKRKIKFVPVDTVDEVLKVALAVEDPETFFSELSSSEPSYVFKITHPDGTTPPDQAPGVH